MIVLRIILLLSATFLSAHEITRSYEYDYLRELVFHGEGKMEIKQGSENHLEISADPALLRNIKISNNRGVLMILPDDVDFSARFPGIINAKLTVKHLEKITLAGNAQVDIDELKGEHFVIVLDLEGAALLEGNLYFDHLITNLYGSGQVSLQGEVKTQTIFLKGTGKYAGQNLKSETANVIIRGPGTAFVWATDELNPSIRGSGNVHHFKHSKSPKILNEKVESKGKVSPYTEGMKK
ncbi:MAG: DUF2807 domain-containing protein [Simkaniaceae bacterium]|nr:MAG: DUF2807 domain-containing protein [Simkaniaceae bacterium]